MNNAKKSLVPHRRFKEFQNAGAWEQRRLGEVAEIKTGSRNHQDSVDNGKYPFFVRSEKVERLNEYDFDTKAILVPGDGRIGEIFHYYDGKFALHQRVYKVDNFKEVNPLYLLNLFKYKFKKHALRLNAQGTVPSLRLSMFTNWNILIPNLNEQQKIGLFFQQLDSLITLHQRKLNKLKKLKSAYLTEMFPDEGEHKPKRRFAGFTDDWEQRKLSKLTTEIGTGKSKYKLQDNGRYPILGSTSVIGYDNNFDYTGDFILTARVGANAGNLYRFAGSVKITDNTVFIKSKYNKFLYYYLQKYDLKKLSFGTGQPLVKASELKNLKILKPRLDEEIYRISKLLLSVDNLITLHQRKIDKLQKLKNAYLNEMFV